MFDYFVQLNIKILFVLMAFGFLMGLARQSAWKNFSRSSRGFLLLDIMNLIGTPVHELSHLVFALLFGYRIDKVCLYRRVRTAKKLGLPTALVNARMSDHSLKGYRRFRMFFAPVLRCFDAICVQTGADRDRYRMIAPDLEDRIVVGGNIKFDQRVPENFRIPDLTKIFPSGGSPVIIGASTHSGEEKMIVGAFRKLREQYKGALLILVPRHAERGAEIAELLKSIGAVVE